jgi:hypothetical protein
VRPNATSAELASMSTISRCLRARRDVPRDAQALTMLEMPPRGELTVP